MAATVTALRPSTGGQQRRPVLVGDAVAQFLATPRCNESPHTHRAYTGALHRVADLVGTNRPLAAVGNTEIATAVTSLWGNCAPTTFNRNRAVVASWLAWCATKAKWTAPALPATCERRDEPADETKAVDQPVIDRICTRRDIPFVSGCCGGCSTRPPAGPPQY